MLKKFSLIFAVVAAFCAAACLGGCYDAGEFSAKTATYSGAEVKSVVIEVTDREVEVLPSQDGGVDISYCESVNEFYDIALSPEGELSITLQIDKNWSDIIVSQPDIEYRKIAISLPDGLDGISISTTNEDIVFGKVQAAGSIALCSNGGSVAVDGPGAGKEISLSAKNGNIAGTVAGSYEDYTINCAIKKGESNLSSNTGGGKLLNLDCNNGDIDIKFAG